MRIAVRIGWVAVCLVATLGTKTRGVQAGDGPAAPTPTLVAQIGHGNTVTSVACSVNGRWVLTGSFDNSACLWDRGSGLEVRRFRGHPGLVTAVAFSPDADGRWVLTGCRDGVARVWDRETGAKVLEYRGHTARVTSVGFSADGLHVITASEDKSARIFDFRTTQEQAAFVGHGDWVASASLSRDGTRVLTASRDGTARLWDRASRAVLRTLAGHAGDVADAVFSPDGKLVLTTGKDRSARLWASDTGAEVGRLAHPDGVTAAAFSPDGRQMLTGCWDTKVRLWDRETKQLLATCAGHEGVVTSVAFAPALAATAGVAATPIQLLSGSFDRTARLWDAATGAQALAFAGRAGAVAAVMVSRDLRGILVASGDGICRLWDREGGKDVRHFVGHTKALTSAALSRDGRWVLTASEDKTVRLWERASGKEVRRYEGHGDVIRSVAFVGDGASLVTACDDKLARIFDRETGQARHTLTGHTDRVVAVTTSVDGRWIVTGSHDRTARLWNATTGQPQRTFAGGHTGQVSCVAITSDGSVVATGGYDKVARLWDVASGSPLRTWGGHRGWITSVAIAPDGRSVVTGSLDGTAMLWGRDGDVPVRTYTGHDGGVTCLTFSEAGDLVFTGSADCTVRVWNKDSGAYLCALISFRDGTWAVVDPEGRYDASGEGRIEGLHWVVGQELILLDQLQSGYYAPGLLDRVVRPPGGPPVARLPVPDFKRLGLAPKVAIQPPRGADAVLKVDLSPRTGGLGKVVVKVDGIAVAERTLDAKGPASGTQAHLEIPLSASPQLTPGRTNTISVEAYNADGSLRSRGVEVDYTPPGKAATDPPGFWGVVVGVSDYANPSMHLRYSAKDAQDIASAMRAGAAGLFGEARTQLTLLCSCEPDRPPRRAAILAALEQAKASKPDDLFVLYLAGHGVTWGTPPDYYFLTAEAASQDLSDAQARATGAISAAQIEEALSLIPARRRLLVFDTCRAGAASAALGRQGLELVDQKRVMARVRQSMATYVLAGCAGSAVSYEANQYAQGLLTYSLLEAMKLAPPEVLRANDRIDVQRLLAYAQRRVPDLAAGIGAMQEPQISYPESQGALELGRVTDTLRNAIKLAKGRPLFGLPDISQEGRPGDPQGLGQAVVAALLKAAQVRESAKLNHVALSSGEGLIQIAGRYVAQGDEVRLTVYLQRLTAKGPVDVGEPFVVQGARGAIAELADRIVAMAVAKASAP